MKPEKFKEGREYIFIKTKNISRPIERDLSRHKIVKVVENRVRNVNNTQYNIDLGFSFTYGVWSMNSEDFEPYNIDYIVELYNIILENNKDKGDINGKPSRRSTKKKVVGI